MKKIILIAMVFASSVAFAKDDKKVRETVVGELAYNAYADAVDAAQTLEAMIDAASEYGKCKETGSWELRGIGSGQVKAYARAPQQYIVTKGSNELIYWRPVVSYSCTLVDKD